MASGLSRSPLRVFGAEHCSSNAVRSANVAHLCFYADSQLHITGEVKDVTQESDAQGERWMNTLVHIAEEDNGDVIVLVDWDGFDAEERTWESLRKVHSSASDFVSTKLRKLRLTRAPTSNLASE